MKKIAFVNGSVFNSDKEAFEKKNIICEDGFIVDITTDAPLDCECIDMSGKYLIPGLVDVHTHGIGGYDFNFVNEESIEAMCLRYAQMGTTSIMATLASDTITNYIKSIFAINQCRLNQKNARANILGTHLEGRYLNPQMKGAHASELLASPNADEANELALAMMPPPAHFSLAPELEGSKEFTEKVCELGATVGIAHTNATFEQAKKALENGARSFTHTFNAMTKVHHRMPGAAVCALTSDEAYAEIIADGEHLHPAIVKLAYKSKPKDKLVLITDSMSATGEPDGEYTIAGSPVTVVNGRAIVLPSGTLAGSTLTMFRAVKNMMKFCDITLNEALKYATVNPAKMVNADFVGKIEKCYRADLIAVNDITSPEIDSVYVGGNKVI
ncbi:MAG: N-acetylglucosamine-6-phosphate deacetylase [Clostridia bacterium]|nr:N-acetylglucosamine-6-phosphate deacetylase [Clostridia bacterium]